jgi:alginate O-acetyltransferase complex protein AlgI
MVFTSPDFLFYFLPLVLALSCLPGVVLQNQVLMLLSLLFYYFGGGWMLLLLLGSCLVNWLCARLLERSRNRVWLVLGVMLNLGNLLWFKYSGFMVQQWNQIVTEGMRIADWPAMVLPIGISFFTFQGISYLVDVWRREMPAYQRLGDVVLCTALFPHLIAGPIVRLSHLTPQLSERTRGWEDISIGAARFTWGLAKKMLIADLCAQLADGGYEVPAFRLSQAAALWMVMAYTVQIYFDFSGYSDMAVGLARMLGFRFPENFHRPYTAVSITDFWRRWHMSLSQWFRDYVFIPLGGSRAGAWKTYRNLALVFLITGAWHGAAWSFIAWGAVHGLLLMLERVSGLAQTEAGKLAWLRRLALAPVIALTWVPFRAPDLEYAGTVLKALFGQTKRVAVPLDISLNLDAQTLLALALGLSAFFMPRHQTGGLWLMQEKGSKTAWARAAVICVLLPLCLLQALSTGYSPFLYFQF